MAIICFPIGATENYEPVKKNDTIKMMIKKRFGEKAVVEFPETRDSRDLPLYNVKYIGLKIRGKISKNNIDKVTKEIIREKEINDLHNIDFDYPILQEIAGVYIYRLNQSYKSIPVLDRFVTVEIKNNELVSYGSCIQTDSTLKNTKIKTTNYYYSTFDSVFNIFKKAYPNAGRCKKINKPILVLVPAKTFNNNSHCICWRIDAGIERIFFNAIRYYSQPFLV